MTAPRKSRTVLLVRGKLGDSIAAWPTVRAYADRHPDEEVWLAVRRGYAPIFAAEPGIRLLPFASSLELYARIVRLRLFGGIERLATLWGFGSAVARVARLSGAKRRCYLDGRFGPLYPETAAPMPDCTIAEFAWSVARVFDADLPRPEALRLPGLAQRRCAESARVIAIAPVADEARKVIDAEALAALTAAAARRFPGCPIWILINPNDRFVRPLIEAGFPPIAEVVRFDSLERLIDIVAQTRHLLTTDTGVYHLAVAMGVPATVFYGPTVPHRIILPGQKDVVYLRQAEMGTGECPVRQCTRPVCLSNAVRQWTGDAATALLADLPHGCVLTSRQPTELK